MQQAIQYLQAVKTDLMDSLPCSGSSIQAWILDLISVSNSRVTSSCMSAHIHLHSLVEHLLEPGILIVNLRCLCTSAK